MLEDPNNIRQLLARALLSLMDLLWRSYRRIRAEPPSYMPDEMLVVASGFAAMPHPEEPQTRALLQMAQELTGTTIQLLEVSKLPGHIEETARARAAGRVPAAQLWDAEHAQRPVTLRLRAVAPPPGLMARDHVKLHVERMHAGIERLHQSGLTVSAIMPNWILSNASPGSGKPQGGPGTIPAPAPAPAAGGWAFTVPERGRWEAKEPPRQRVIVAVLDTWPDGQLVDRAAKSKRFATNGLLGRLAKPESDSECVVSDLHAFTPPHDIPQIASNSEADHGLFVSGIINSIAPHARIHLLHILSDTGFGQAKQLLDALDYCLHLAQSGHRVVVNLSLYLRIPPQDQLWNHWFGPLTSSLTTGPAGKQAMLEQLDGEIKRRIDHLTKAGVLIVAAAGNDGMGLAANQHPQPRVPADYDNVLCVVAADRTGKLAGYSNRGDLLPAHHCVACFGGEGELLGDVCVVPQAPDPRDAVAGVYIDSTFRVPARGATTTWINQENESGWAYWSGTSFSTPIVSAIAANLLGKNALEHQSTQSVAELTPREVIQAIIAMAEPVSPDPNLGAPYIKVTQTQ